MGHNRESQDKLKYLIVLSKFVVQFVEVATMKSFGVLIPTMLDVFSTDASSLMSLGMACSMPVSMMAFGALPMAYVLKSAFVSPRAMAVTGAITSSLGIIISGYLTSVFALGFCLSLTGIGLSMVYIPVNVLLNDHFPENFVLVNTIALLGSTVGSLVVPFFVERALRAYGFSGAMLILGGISMYAIPTSVYLKQIERAVGKGSETSKSTAKKSSDYLRGSARTVERCQTLTKSAERTTVSPRQPTRAEEQGRQTTVKMAKTIDGCQTPLIDGDDCDHEVIEIDDEQPCNIPTQTDKPQNQGKQSLLVRLWHSLQECIILQEPLLLLSLPCLLLSAVIVNSWFLFLVPRAVWHGIPVSKAVLLSSLAGAGGFIGRIISIIALFFKIDFILVFLIFGAISSTVFLLDPLLTSFSVMCVAAFLQGVCIFNFVISYAALLKGSVSNENFTVGSGIFGFVAGLGGNLGSLMSGAIKDKTGSYTSVFLTLGVINCLVVFLTIAFLVARHRWNRLKS
ncbi:uncharacterized protein LOC121417438 isoform X1 [Lytechinus variegatus]|uniref:uncharacterized protein LOC121417438 isoform X1 n=1 Tax=Lytechinus variegatus TaxID=7654 RepID=UPI001BB216CE|nr:uncharacterized protein LOC121417438 isoform X1 [Lytechinus variegatus]